MSRRQSYWKISTTRSWVEYLFNSHNAEIRFCALCNIFSLSLTIYCRPESMMLLWFDSFSRPPDTGRGTHKAGNLYRSDQARDWCWSRARSSCQDYDTETIRAIRCWNYQQFLKNLPSRSKQVSREAFSSGSRVSSDTHLLSWQTSRLSYRSVQSWQFFCIPSQQRYLRFVFTSEWIDLEIWLSFTVWQLQFWDLLFQWHISGSFLCWRCLSTAASWPMARILDNSSATGSKLAS